MIIYNREDKKISIPKGIGNVSVDVMSGSTDTITEEKVARMISAASRSDRDYTDSAIEAAIAANNYDVFLNPDSFEYWETPVENINNLFALTERLGRVYSGAIRIFIRCDSRETPLAFHILNLTDNSMDIEWVGQTYEDLVYHPTTLRIRKLSIDRGQAIAEGSMFDTLLIEERAN